ncbi:hypothetical protein IV417_10690 [Alphaproteobacteria bacterium KMM 3653]|uniref:Uncharacterized protein n=1 Tax=Harenicola maris TaxID=2841044 RepID=A0AAP2CUD7_9RHOB|nr:hypothetical protein [Harenicola maris]
MRKTQKSVRRFTTLTSAVALSAGLAAPAMAQDNCQLDGRVLPEGCDQGNSNTVVRMPVGENTEFDRTAVTNSDGFVLSVDGQALNSDQRFEDQVRETDKALEKSGVQVKYDTLGLEPRLDVTIEGAPARYTAGEVVTLQSRMNYPAFVERGEMRIIDRGALGGPRTLSVHPVAPNGAASVTLPEGADVVVVHRVYDERGRYDETAPLSLTRADARGLSDVEEGSDSTLIRRIPVNGASVTVTGNAADPGSRVEALGETTEADAQGNFVLQRIVPRGEQEAEVTLQQGGREASFAREFDVKPIEWFYVGTADLTYSKSTIGGIEEDQTTGRVAFYVDGTTVGGTRITASLDTGEEDIGDIFSNLDEKDPASILDRLDPLDTYPTFGDDSTTVDNTPTSGRIYFKAERNGNHLIWGDYRSTVSGAKYIRSERELYGAQVYLATPQQTESGNPRAELELYAAQPDTLPGRDAFLGTGGSVYFLQRQDITSGTETITVQVRDVDTGRVIDTQVLQFGRDYNINYLQGVVTLTSPLLGTGNNNLVQSNLGGDTVTNLIVQYDYTPTAADLDGFSVGGRGQVWVTDKLRFGISGQSDETGLGGKQEAYGADILYQHSENTFVKLEYAQSEGPGFDSSYSFDGGLIVDNIAGAAGEGEAYNFEAQVDLRDLGFGADGVVGGYYEFRTEGFSTLDYQVNVGSGDQTLYGAYAQVDLREDLSFKAYADVLETSLGARDQTIGFELEADLTDRVTLAVGAEHREKSTDTGSNQRTDVAAKLSYQAREDLSLSIFGQATVDDDGLGELNRYGLGVVKEWQSGWSLEAEVTGGTGGTGGKVLASYQRDKNASYYFGYELDPGREFTSNVAGVDGGKFISGGNRIVNDRVRYFGENSYDIFGARKTLASAYGVQFEPSDYLTYDAALEVGRITDPDNGDFDRTALSLGVRYSDDKTTAQGRLEFRQDRGTTSGTNRDSDTVLVSAKLRHKFDESQRLVFSLDAADTQTDESSILSGTYVDLALGYAYRPIDNDKLNVLVRYRFLNDMYGQEIDGVAGEGPVQRSHVLSLDASYDLNEHWTLGGKLGYRLSETAPDASSELVTNNAGLAVINARYHLVHNWDILLEGRALWLEQSELTETSILGAVYRHVGNHVKVGVGYNFGSFSDDLNDLVHDDKGMFVNVIAKF